MKIFQTVILIVLVIYSIGIKKYYQNKYTAQYTGYLSCTDFEIQDRALDHVKEIRVNGRNYKLLYDEFAKTFESFTRFNIIENVSTGVEVEILYEGLNGENRLFSEWFKKGETGHIEIKLSGKGVKITKSYG
jgi:hypothetical protein